MKAKCDGVADFLESLADCAPEQLSPEALQQVRITTDKLKKFFLSEDIIPIERADTKAKIKNEKEDVNQNNSVLEMLADKINLSSKRRPTMRKFDESSGEPLAAWMVKYETHFTEQFTTDESV